MKYEEHQASVMVDGKALEEFNVEHTYDKNTNTHTCTAEIAYTHNANFSVRQTYFRKRKGEAVTVNLRVDGQFANNYICIGKSDQDEKFQGSFKGFRTANHGYKPFRWSRLAHRADIDDEKSSTSSLPPEAGTIKLHIDPRKNVKEQPLNANTSDGPLNANGLRPSKGMIKPALVVADAEVAQKPPTCSCSSDHDKSRPVVIMIWKYMLRDLIVDRSQGSPSATLGAPSSSSASNSTGSNAQSPAKRKRELDEEAEQLQSRWAAIKQERLQLRETTANVKPEPKDRVRSRAGSNASVQSVPAPVRERTGQSISIDLTELDDDDE